MKIFQRAILWVGIAVLAAPLPVLAAASTMASPSGLSFTELKITGDEFVILQNNTGSAIPDLSIYWLQDFNNVNPLAGGISNSSQQLPQVALGSGQTLLLSSATMPTCGAAIAGKLSVSLTDGGGFLELVKMTQNSSGAITQTPGDVVSWSSSANGIIQNVPSGTKDPKAAYYRYHNDTSYSWQLADQDASTACLLNVTVAGTTKPETITASLGQSTTSPPAIIIGLSADDASNLTASGATLPASDLGLLAPQVTELLPNPSGTGTDNSDEFIELYNPNDTAFDLSGFSLQVGTSTLHAWPFPAGVMLPAKGFMAFFSEDTGLSMSNTGGQAALLDPFGDRVGQSDVYANAGDGQAWALANGKWYWTTTPTPSAGNVIKQPIGSSKSSSKATKTTSSSKTTISKVKGASVAVSSTAGTTGSMQAVAEVTPIHPWTLALVALLALLYGAYEYRTDIRNKVAQFRADRAARRIAG